MSLFTPVATNYIPVRDLAAAGAWYAEKFGLRARPAHFDDGQKGIELVLSDEIFFVLGPGDPDPTPNEAPMLYASRIEKAHHFLSARGVSVTEVSAGQAGDTIFRITRLRRKCS